MPQLPEIPAEHLPICNALVLHALRKGPEPRETPELEAFRSWILYESGAMGEDDYQCVVALNRLEFEDDRVRYVLGLDDDAPISDAQRLAYAREFIDTYGDDGNNDPHYAESFELPTPSGPKVLYCCVAEMTGQSGIFAEWYGCYLDRGEFFDRLRHDGYWVLSDPASKIPDNAIFARWYHPERRI